MSHEETPVVRVVARDSRIKTISDTYERHRFLHRRARMQALGRPRLAIIPNDEIGLEILQFGLYEGRILTLLFDDVLKPFKADFIGKTVLDIGANIENHTIYLSRRFEHVIAFEPGAIAWHLLNANLLLNDVRNVTPLRIGLSNSDSQARLVQIEADNIGSSAVSAHDTTTGEPVQLRRSDEVLADIGSLGKVALVKIDIEGHEVSALRGLESTLRTHRPIILFETAGKYGPGGSDAILAMLKEFGYGKFYTLEKDFPFPRWHSPIVRAALRAARGCCPAHGT